MSKEEHIWINRMDDGVWVQRAFEKLSQELLGLALYHMEGRAHCGQVSGSEWAALFLILLLYFDSILLSAQLARI